MSSESNIGESYGLFFYKICITIFIFCLSFLFGYLPLKLDKLGKNYQFIGVINAFSGGIFLSISLLHLMPESSDLFHEYYKNLHKNDDSHHEFKFPLSYFLAFCGYTLILLIEKIIFDSHCPETQTTSKSQNNSLEKSLKNSKRLTSKPKTEHLLNEAETKENFQKNKENKNKNHAININKNLEGIKESDNEEINIDKKRQNTFNLNLHSNTNVIQGEEIKKRKKMMSAVLNKRDLQLLRDNESGYNEQSDEYINEVSRKEERKEQKFKKYFTARGRFASLAKENFRAFSIKQEITDEFIPREDFRDKVFAELFDQTRPSITDKEQLLHKEDHNLFNKKNITSFLLLLALSVHSFFEGIAIGLLDEDREIFYMLLAISFHKLVEALSIGINLNKSIIDKEVLLVLIIMFSLTTPVGIIFGIILRGISQFIEAFLLSISAGTFLYISVSEVVIEEFSISQHKLQKFTGFVVGSVIITFFTIFEYSH